MNKKIILITTAEREWEYWKKWAQGNEQTIQNNKITGNIKNYELVIFLSNQTELSYILTQLNNIIQDRSSEIAIGIHVPGYPPANNQSLRQYANQEEFEIAEPNKEKYSKPSISFYTTGGNYESFVEKCIRDPDYLYHRILRQQPTNPELEKQLEGKWRNSSQTLTTLTIIKCKDEFPKNLKENDPIYVAAECKCDQYEYYTDFNGIKQFNGTIYRLRTCGFKNPIIVVTFCNDISELKNKSQLLTSSGIAIWNPSQEPPKVSPIDNITLMDIQRTFLNIKGLVQEALHNLSPNRNENEIDKIFEELKNLLPYYTAELTNLENSVKEDPNNQIPHVKEKIKSLVKSQEEEVKKLNEIKESKIDITWKFLVIEDNDADYKKIHNGLKKRDFPENNILRAKSYTEAKEHLTNDRHNEITALIVDHRLYDENGNWQEIQGYSIIKNIISEFPDRNLCFFVLTGIDKNLLIELEREIGVKTFPFTKETVLSNETEFNLFAKELYEKSKEEYDASISLKGKANWERRLKPLYVKLRRREDHENIFQEINQNADELLNKFLNNRQEGVIQRQGGVIQNLQANPGTPTDLIPKLTARLFIIKLWCHLRSEGKEFNKNDVYTFLTGNQYPSNSAIKQLFSTHLAINPDEDILTGNLLPEEKIYVKDLLENLDIISLFKELIPAFYKLSGVTREDIENVNIKNVDDILKELKEIKDNESLNAKRIVAKFILDSKIMGNLIKAKYPEIKKILEKIAKNEP